MSASPGILCGILFALACSRDKGPSDDTATDDSGTDDSGTDDTGSDDSGADDTGGPTDFAITVTQSRDGVSLQLSGGVGSYLFGMATTDPNSFDPWTGEDCYDGYTTSDGELYSFCHPAGATGVELAGVDNYTEVVSGSTTIMQQVSVNVTTYYLLSGDTLQCWVWGQNIAYYAGLGCAEYEG